MKKFVHITDVHWDPFIRKTGDPAQFCHRGIYFDERYPAACDSSWELIETVIEKISKVSPEIVLWTGDSSRHDHDPIIKKRSEETLAQNKKIVNLLKEKLSAVILPSIGNWDVSPASILGPGPNIQLSALWKIWAPLFKHAEPIEKTFLKGGWYNYQVDDTLAVISLNTLYFFQVNDAVEDCSTSFHLHGQRSVEAPGDAQLAWLNATLTLNAQMNVSSIIIGHIPPLDESNNMLYHPGCYESFLYVLNANAENLVGTFFGHINKDLLFPLVERSDGKLRLTALTQKTHASFDFSSGRIRTGVFNNVIVIVLSTSPSILPIYHPSFKAGIINQTGTPYILKQSQYSLSQTSLFSESCKSQELFELKSYQPLDIQDWITRTSSEASTLFDTYNQCIHVHVPPSHDRLFLANNTVAVILGLFALVFCGAFVFLVSWLRGQRQGEEQQRLMEGAHVHYNTSSNSKPPARRPKNRINGKVRDF